MTLTRIIVDKKTGKAKEQDLPSDYKHASDEEIARRKRMEAERSRRFPFSALNPQAHANHPHPKGQKTEEMEAANIRENPEGGKTQGSASPEVEQVETEEVEEEVRGKDSGTEPSEDEGGDQEQDTPDDEEE